MVVITAVSLIGAFALLRDQRFRQYLLGIAYTRVSQAAGVELRMRDFSVHLSGLSPTVDMFDVEIAGAAPYQTPPLAKADRLSVSIQVVSLLQRKWYLKDLAVDHPVVRVVVRENGETNLPQQKSAGRQTSIFDLGVRHAVLGKGEFYYNDQKSDLDADVRNLEFQAGFEPDSKRYSGALRYADGKIRFQNLGPVVHKLEAEFESTPDAFTLKRSTLTSGGSQLNLAATVNDFARPDVAATYFATLDTGEIRELLKDARLPRGVIKLAGSVTFPNDPNKSMLEVLTASGIVSSDGLEIQAGSINTLIRDINARYELQKGNLEVRDLRAGLFGGGVDASFKMQDVAGGQLSELQANLRDVPLARIQALVNPQALDGRKLTGTANAKVSARWRRALDALTAHADAEFKGKVASAAAAQTAASREALLVADGSIHADYSAAAQTISFSRSYVRTPNTNLSLNGTVSKTATLQVQLQANDVSELETIASSFGALTQPLGLAGMATFTGVVRGSTTAPEISGQFSATSLKVKGTEWRMVRTGIEASPSRLVLRNGDIAPANSRGRLTFNVDLGMDRWTFDQTRPLQVDLRVAQLDVADIKNLAGVQMPVTGLISANASFTGSLNNPVGRGNISVTQATVADEPIQSASLDFQVTGDEIRSRLRLQATAGTIQSSVTYFPKRKAYDGELQADGLRLDQIRTLRARNVGVAGALSLNAKGSGALDNPQVELRAQIPQLQLQNQRLNGVTLQASVADRVATVALDSQPEALNTFVRGHGQIHLTGDYETDAAFDTSAISLQPLIALYSSTTSSDLTGQTEIHGTVKGPLADKTKLDAHIAIPTLSVSYKNNVQFAAVQPIQMDFSKGVLTVQKTEVRGPGANLQLQGTIPVTGSAPISILALGAIDLGVVQMFNPDIASSGQIRFNIGGGGRAPNSNIQGEIHIVNASFAGGALPLGLNNGNGVLTLTNTRLEIDKFEGNVGGGTLTASGVVTYRPSVQFNVSLAGSGIRTLYPQGVREGIDTNLTLVGSAQSALLRGQVRLTELSFSPTFDFGDITSLVGGTLGSAAPPGGFARALNLDLQVVSASELSLASSKLSLQGATNVRLRGTAAQPAVIGRVNVSGGDLIFRGNRYIVDSSTLDFVNPYSIDPRVNLAISTKVQDYDIRMLFRGTLDNLRTTYTSDPPLPPSDIINLLVFGKVSETQASTPTFGNLGAESILASSVSNQVTSGIEKIAGISHLSVDPMLGGNQQDLNARITIQQRVTGNLFVTYSTDAASTQRQVLKLEYQATPRIGFSGVRDQNGGFALDMKIKKTW